MAARRLPARAVTGQNPGRPPERQHRRTGHRPRLNNQVEQPGTGTTAHIGHPRPGGRGRPSPATLATGKAPRQGHLLAAGPRLYAASQVPKDVRSTTDEPVLCG
ncbi:hypothetical protein GCM10009731_04270 [Streptomyces globosus]